MIATGLCIAGVLLVVRGWRDRARPALAGVGRLGALAAAHRGAAWCCSARWCSTSRRPDWLGFLPTAALILLAHVRRCCGCPPRRALLLAVVATLVIHFAFYKLLRVPLPWGVLTPYAW